jgi:hypothetical protein
MPRPFRRIWVLPAPSLLCAFALIPFPFKQITRKRPQPRKFVTGIHIFLDHVKRKIIKPAKTPDRNHQQRAGCERRIVEYQQGGRQNADDQKQNSFQLNPARVSQVFHPDATCIGRTPECHELTWEHRRLAGESAATQKRAGGTPALPGTARKVLRSAFSPNYAVRNGDRARLGRSDKPDYNKWSIGQEIPPPPAKADSTLRGSRSVHAAQSIGESDLQDARERH